MAYILGPGVQGAWSLKYERIVKGTPKKGREPQEHSRKIMGI